MKELILSPEEIYYIGKVSGGKYLDYDYIAAMQDIGCLLYTSQLLKQLQFANCLFILEIELPAPTVRVIA